MADHVEGEYGRRSWWLLLLLIPFVTTLWLPFYAHYNPTLWGLPFFYWYQFLWVVITVIITAVVYWLVG
jgi:Na+/melibiose symporter-like transporter